MHSNSNLKKIKLSSWSTSPGPRFKKDGRFSGEEYREAVLVPLLNEFTNSGTRILVDLDGTEALPSSFLEEAFGGLARRFPNQSINDFVAEIKSERWYYRDAIRRYIEKARG
tara:strand:- start:693 stop:1028 length:336 start_codon:yes stop_codon:yes gene_type:complete